MTPQSAAIVDKKAFLTSMFLLGTIFAPHKCKFFAFFKIFVAFVKRFLYNGTAFQGST